MRAARPTTGARRGRRLLGLVVVTAFAVGASACGDEGGADGDDAAGEGGTVRVVIGYQSKTINTVTAGTLLRERGYFEQQLAEVGATNGTTYEVVWQDYPSGPPITAQMLAAKVDIGSMGDYPALVNGSKTASVEEAASSLVSVTGYNRRGSLNGIVVPIDSDVESLADLAEATVSVPFGSAAHGMIAAALDDLGRSTDDVALVNQQPEVGATAIEAGQVDAVAGFVPWPDVLVFRGTARKVFDGGDTGVPTMHVVVQRDAFAAENPEVAEAFLAAQLEATEFVREHPLEAAQIVADISGLEVEVVYLFNGPNGVVTFDPTIKDEWVAALEGDVPFLESLNSLTDLDVEEFVDDSLLRSVYGEGYDADAASFTNPSAITGEDEICGGVVEDQLTASEAWFDGEGETRVARTPTCLLRLIDSRGGLEGLRVAYVPDADTGTRLFAASAVWVEDPTAGPENRFEAFATAPAAAEFIASAPGAREVPFEAAIAAAATG